MAIQKENLEMVQYLVYDVLLDVNQVNSVRTETMNYVTFIANLSPGVCV